MARELGLAAEQKQKLLELVDQREDEAVELLYLTPEEQAQKLVAFRRESEAKGLALLDAQQRALLERIRIRRLGLASAAEPAVSDRLKLTPEQQTQVAGILRQRDEQLRVADEQTVHVIRADAERKLSTVLSSQQRAAWEGMVRGEATGPAEPPAADRILPPPTGGADSEPAQPADTAPADTVPGDTMPADVAPGDAVPADTAVAEPGEGQSSAPAVGPPTDVSEPGVVAEPGTVAEPADRAEQGTSANQPPDKPVMLRFNFRYQPWKDVIDWFAEQADLSYVGDMAPQGTFNYTDSREYTAAEAIDLLNSVLLTKGYTLVRRNRMLMLINLEDGIPPNFVTTIALEDLDDRGEYELVSVLFQLENVTSEEVEDEIRKLVGPQGSVVTLPMSRQVLVTETAGRLRAIRAVIRRIEDPEGHGEEQMQAVDIKYATPDEVLTVVRRLLDIPEDGNATGDGSLRFALDPMGNRLLVTGKPEAIKRLEDILKLVDVPPQGGVSNVPQIDQVPQLEVYSITSADPASVLAVIQTLLAGQPDVRLSLDPKTDNLVALARPYEHATIRATLDQMQREAQQVEVIHLTTIDPQLAVLSINKLFEASGEKAAKNAPKVDADPTSRQLLVRGTEAQIQQIRDLLEKMGESGEAAITATGTGNVRMLPLTGRAAQSALDRIQKLWPTMRGNPIRVVTPSAVSPILRNGEPGDSSGMLPAAPMTDPAISPRLPAMWRSTPGATGGRQPSNEGRRDESEQRRGPPSFGRPPWERGDDRSRGDRSTRAVWGARVFLASQSIESPAVPAESQPMEPPPTEPQPVAPRPSETPSDEPPAGEPADAEPMAVEPPVLEPPAPTPPSRPAVAPPSQEPWGDAPPMVDPWGEEGPSVGTTAEPSADSPQSFADSSEPPPIIVAPGPGGVMIACQDVEVLNEFERLLTTLTENLTSAGPELTIFYLKHATAAVVAQTLDQILGGGTIATEQGGGGGLIGDLAGAALGDGIMGALLGLGGGSTIAPTGAIKITPDSRLNALVVQANPIDLDMIEQVLKILDQKGSPEDVLVVPKAKMIPVFNTQADEIAGILRQVYQDRMVASSQGGGGGRAPSPEDLMRLLRGNRGGSGNTRSQREEQQKMSIGIDVRSNSLIVAAPEPLLTEVEQLITRLDVAATETSQAMQVVTLRTASPEAVQRALNSMMGDAVQFNRSSGRSGGSGSSTTSSYRGPTSGSTRGGSSATDDRRAFFMDMMRRRMEGGGGGPGGGGPGGGGRGGGGRGR
ncbi:MAG: hypothetical protein JXB62_19315 [Pirellulales bacterium]|nr:hypothetical protein [Pirellulales bacterium]